MSLLNIPVVPQTSLTADPPSMPAAGPSVGPVDRLHRTPGIIPVDPAFTAGPEVPDAFRIGVVRPRIRRVTPVIVT